MVNPQKMEWRLKEENPTLAGSISNKLEISSLVSRILVARGLKSAEEVYSFLNPTLRQMHDPFLMKGMKKAAERIIQEAKSGKRIVVHGDYDVDGITSTALMCSFLRDNFPGIEVDTFLPSRFNEGYGLSPKCIEDQIQKGTGLMITVDCGIRAMEEARSAMEGGIDLIITDHHEPGEEVPDAYVVIDPKMEGCGYPFRDLAGVGVALKLAHAVSMKTDSGTDIRDYLDLAALGTIADMVPMIDENRALCHFGLKKLQSTKRMGLNALMRESGVDISRGISSTDVGFKLAPRLNSAGRLGHPDLALDLILTDDRVDADLFSRELTTLNYKRQAIGSKLVDDIMNRIKELDLSRDPSIVLSGEGWNPGVIGVCASRVMDSMAKPVIILAQDGDLVKGSARSPRGLDLLEALSHMTDLFIEFGGHERAAGMTMRADLVDDLRKRLNNYLESKFPDQIFRPLLEIDIDVSLDEIDIDSVSEIQNLGPFGIENPNVQISVRDAVIGNDMKAVGSGKHLKFSIEDEGVCIPCIWFGSGDFMEMIPPGTLVDVSGQPDLHHWMGNTDVQLRISDIHVK